MQGDVAERQIPSRLLPTFGNSSLIPGTKSYTGLRGIQGAHPTNEMDPLAIKRPAPDLLRYYLLVSALTLFAFPFVFIPLYLRYRTLRYRFDDDGISISHGVLFRKEVNLTFRRIQDIHVTMNVLQRWMGLATIEIQTASGSATAEGKIEGILTPHVLRDFLYARMRGAREGRHETESDEALELLVEIRDHIRKLVDMNRPEDLQK